MASAVGRRLCEQDYNGDSDEVTLPSIVGRLSRLETTGFSYDELLHDFASRRRLGPLEECPATYVVDPAQETDEIVQVRQIFHVYIFRAFCWRSSALSPGVLKAGCTFN